MRGKAGCDPGVRSSSCDAVRKANSALTANFVIGIVRIRSTTLASSVSKSVYTRKSYEQ